MKLKNKIWVRRTQADLSFVFGYKKALKNNLIQKLPIDVVVQSNLEALTSPLALLLRDPCQ
jgi:hypothetical protein